MVRNRGIVAALLTAMIFVVPGAIRAADATQSEVDQLKKDIEDLRRKLSSTSTAMPKTTVDKALENRYGPNATVTTRCGKLTISGLLQVWYQGTQNDNRALFDTGDGTILDTNAANDADTFRIRRSELKFTMDIHENVTAVVMIDPAREALSFTNANNNQGQGDVGLKRINNIAPEIADAAFGSTSAVQAVQIGTGGTPRLLQDAYINYHGVVPHHDFTVGQFVPAFGEEGSRSSAMLDFAERSFIGQGANLRDMGAQMHGFWWDDRFQYWIAAFDGAGDYHGTSGQAQNRSDDNDNKDMLFSTLVRPLWKSETWGSLELGGSAGFGRHGQNEIAAAGDVINGLNRQKTWAQRVAAWASYMPGSVLRGFWVRGEWQKLHDRAAPFTVLDPTAVDFQPYPARAFSRQGWYLAAGYKISESRWCDNAPGWLKPFEFAFRYQSFDSTILADLANTAHTDVFKSDVFTAGINYYIKGHNAKIQANYNVMHNPSGGVRNFHDVRNDNFIVSFQVAF